MRLPKTEVERRRQVVLSYFRQNPTASVAKLNAALKSGELTGKPEKMLNIATGYKWRKEAIATPELPGVVVKQFVAKGIAEAKPGETLDQAEGRVAREEFSKSEAAIAETFVSSDGSVIDPATIKPSTEPAGKPAEFKVIPCGDGCQGCAFCRAEPEGTSDTVSPPAESPQE